MSDEAQGGTRRDREQTKWANALLLTALLALPLTVMSSGYLWVYASGQGQPQLSAMALGPLASCGCFAVIWQGLRKGDHAKRWLNDELMRTYQARALSSGFIAGYAAMAVVFGLMLWRLPVAVAAMPYAMLAMVSVAMGHMWWQVKRADNG